MRAELHFDLCSGRCFTLMSEKEANVSLVPAGEHVSMMTWRCAAMNYGIAESPKGHRSVPWHGGSCKTPFSSDWGTLISPLAVRSCDCAAVHCGMEVEPVCTLLKKESCFYGYPHVKIDIFKLWVYFSSQPQEEEATINNLWPWSGDCACAETGY